MCKARWITLLTNIFPDPLTAVNKTSSYVHTTHSTEDNTKGVFQTPSK